MQINSIYSSPIVVNYGIKSKTKQTEQNTNNVNFGLHNPQAAYNRALQLKSDYAKLGINYIMPSKVWSDSKVAKMVNRVDSSVKAMIAASCLTKEKIEEEINKTMPDEDKNSIKIYDLKDLEKELIKEGYSKQEAKKFVETSGGMQMPVDDKSGIFLPIEQCLSESDDEYYQLNLRMTLAHELTHAYMSKFQNIEASHNYHYEKLSNDNFYERDFFNNFEQIFYDKFDKDSVYDKVKHPSEQGFYKFIQVKNEEDLFKEFDRAFNKVVFDDFATVPPKVHNSKQFFNYCKSRAQDEKEAYKTNRIMDELEKPYGVPIKNDYQSELYAKMEKYFRLRAQNAQNLPEQE